VQSLDEVEIHLPVTDDEGAARGHLVPRTFAQGPKTGQVTELHEL
jgi:hypothetical protein